MFNYSQIIIFIVTAFITAFISLLVYIWKNSIDKLEKMQKSIDDLTKSDIINSTTISPISMIQKDIVELKTISATQNTRIHVLEKNWGAIMTRSEIDEKINNIKNQISDLKSSIHNDLNAIKGNIASKELTKEMIDIAEKLTTKLENYEKNN